MEICNFLVGRIKKDDLERNSEIVTELAETPTLEEPTDEEVEAHGKFLSKKTYDFIKRNDSASAWTERDLDIFDQAMRDVQKTPKGNTVLHIAALYGNYDCVERVVRHFPQLLAETNVDGDTALHVAAKASSFYPNLYLAILHNLAHSYSEKPNEALKAILVKNRKGNTFFHEALLKGHQIVVELLYYRQVRDIKGDFLELVKKTLFAWTEEEENSFLSLAIEKGFEDIVDCALAWMIPHAEGTSPARCEKVEKKIPSKPHSLDIDMKMMERRLDIRGHSPLIQDLRGKSPLMMAILKQNQGILEKIVKVKEWIHFKDNKGRNALHYAASTGYLNGVDCLLQNCGSCNMEKDKDGLFPLHLASACGHAEVVKKLLENCSDAREIVDNYGRNFVHIAAQMGQFNVVRYVLQDANEVIDMINDQDNDGNTPLHLAASHYHPKVVQALTWNHKVDLNLLNKKNQTALDAFEESKQENPSLRQRLTWSQLKSAGVQNAKRGSSSIEVPPPSTESGLAEAPKTDFYKDRINTLIVVSTLIFTVAFAAGFTLPGGANSSTPGQGMAVMLKHVWFKPFIFCITTSMYGGISVTIILIWAQLGDITLALFALRVARPLLGVSLATLSVAFLAGIHLVISDLSWLATTILIWSVILILLLMFLYTLLWFPSDSSCLIIRWISFFPFKFLTWLSEKDST